MALPAFPEDAFLEACELLVRTDKDWVPDGEGESSLTVRVHNRLAPHRVAGGRRMR